MFAKELRDQSDKELLDLLEDQREAMFNLRFQDAFGQMEDPNALINTRRDIARILTVLTERQISASAVAPQVGMPQTKQTKKKRN